MWWSAPQINYRGCCQSNVFLFPHFHNFSPAKWQSTTARSLCGPNDCPISVAYVQPTFLFHRHLLLPASFPWTPPGISTYNCCIVTKWKGSCKICVTRAYLSCTTYWTSLSWPGTEMMYFHTVIFHQNQYFQHRALKVQSLGELAHTSLHCLL